MNLSQLLDNDEALALFFTDEVYLIDKTAKVEVPASSTAENAQPTKSEPIPSEPLAPVEVPAIIPILDIKTSTPVKFQFKGKNLRKILLLVKNKELDNPLGSPEGRLLLNNLMKATHIGIEDVAMVNWASYSSASFADLKASLDSQIVLSFGVSATELGLVAATNHQIVEIEGVKFIFTHLANELVADKESKTSLWRSLQTLFLV